MNLDYFKEAIFDELHGAEDYIKNAIEIKPMNPSWSKMLVEMSAAELSHAANLFKMYQEYYKLLTDSYKEVPMAMQEFNKDIVDNYTAKASKVRHIHDLYAKI